MFSYQNKCQATKKLFFFFFHPSNVFSEKLADCNKLIVVNSSIYIQYGRFLSSITKRANKSRRPCKWREASSVCVCDYTEVWVLTVSISTVSADISTQQHRSLNNLPQPGCCSFRLAEVEQKCCPKRGDKTRAALWRCGETPAFRNASARRQTFCPKFHTSFGFRVPKFPAFVSDQI